MRKFYLFMLMAVGLLVSTTMSAAPERPVPPAEPQGQEGVEMVNVKAPTPTDKIVVPAHKENAAPKFGADINAANIVKAPRKAAMGVENTNVAKIGDTEYPTLAAAIDAYQEGVITLIADVTESVEITKDVQINCDTYTLSNTEGDDYVIKVSNNANVTLAGNYPSTLICAGGHSIQVEEGASVKIFGQLAFVNPSFVGSVIFEGGAFTVTDYEAVVKDFVDLETYKPLCAYFPNLSETEAGVIIVKDDGSFEATAKATLANDKEYEFETFANAKLFVKEGGTITLLTEYWGTMTLDKNLTLDLNGNTLYYYYAWYVLYIKNNANVTIKNGDILTYHYQYLNNDGSWSGYAAYAVYVSDGSVSLDNVRISSYSALYSSAPAREKGPYYGVYIYDGSVAMTDSQVDAYYYGIRNDGSSVSLTNNDIYSKYYGVYLYNGSLIYNSGKILAEGSYSLMLYAYYGAINATIEDGVFENTNSAGWPLYIYGSPKAATATINGGYFKGAGFDVYNYAYGASGSFIKIYGGTFYKSANTKIFDGGAYSLYGGRYDDKDGLGIDLPAGYSFGKGVADGKYGKTVYPLIQAKASTAGYGFASVEEALADVDFDGTVKLIANVENATINKNATLDLDIYSVTGTLTVTDGIKVDVKSYDKGNIHDIVATKEDVTLYGGNYDFLPSSKATIAEGLDLIERPNYPSEGKYTLCKERVAYIVNAPEDTTYYWTLQEAINAAGKGDTILLKKDFSILDGVEVKSGQEVVIDLNGHIISGQRTPTTGWQLVNNNGKLTLMDNTDVNKDGMGQGKLSTENFYSADLSFNPTYAVNLIRNAGTLIIESGLYETFGLGQAAYSIDQYGGSTTINGGKVITLSTSFAIRIFFPSSLNNKFYINGGIISSLWVQSGSAFTLHIQNAEILANISVAATTTNFDILLKNVVMASDWTLTGDARSATYVVDSVRISGYNLQGNLGENAFQHLKNGQYQFEDAYMGNENASSWKKHYSEDEGYYAVPIPSNPSVVQVYKSGQANIRAFMPYIMDGYGLVCIDEENKWYEIRPIQGTTGDENVEGHDGELGNPWHQDRTWDLHKDEVVPQDTTPVHIDHDVYVETGTKADAASIIVKSEQTLTIQEGATLIVGAGGIVFNNEDDKTPGKIVVEPGATLLDGANGIISEDTRNIIIQASETAQGTFLFDPEVSLNTHPFGTVELISRSGLRKYPNGSLVNYWHRFASPVMELKADDFTNNWETYRATTGLQIAAGTYFQTQIYQWSSSIYDWQRIDKLENYWDSIVPFQGYTMLNNCEWDDTHKGGVTYTFRGNLVGNHNDDLSFLCKGYNYFGNSYTAPINIKELLNAVDNDDINRTVYIWDAELQVFRGWSFEQLLFVDDETTPASIPSMQTFVMQLLNGNSAVSQIDYVNAIWNPVVNAVTSNKAPQKAQQVLDATLKINITAANGEKDAVVMMKDGRYSNQLDNGADAEKYMNNGSVNFYAHADFANVSTMADTEIEGTMLSLVSNDETEFIMTFSAVTGDQYAIRDNLTGSLITIAEGNAYAFSTNANSTDENRFEIVALHRAPTDVENTEVNAKAKGIYSVIGQYLGEANEWFKLPAGVYVMDGQKVVK